MTSNAARAHEIAQLQRPVTVANEVAGRSARAIILKRVISDAKRELESIDAEFKALHADNGRDELYARGGKRLVSRLIHTGQNRFDQKAFGIKHPLLLKAFTRWYPYDQVEYHDITGTVVGK